MKTTTAILLLLCCTPALAQSYTRAGVAFFCHECGNPRDKVICVGEAISSRAISHGMKGNADSAIGTNGDKCYFSVDSKIGSQIRKVCSVRDMNITEQEGNICMVEASLAKDGKIIKLLRVEIAQD